MISFLVVVTVVDVDVVETVVVEAFVTVMLQPCTYPLLQQGSSVSFGHAVICSQRLQHHACRATGHVVVHTASPVLQSNHSTVKVVVMVMVVVLVVSRHPIPQW
jgi:hypothetical protein